jgi:tetratricopeptide (TPR) repeat protein
MIITTIYSTDNILNRSPMTVAERALSTFDMEDTSINRRLMIYKITLDMIKDKPLLGAGIGSFKYNFLDYQAQYIKENPSYIKNARKAAEEHNEYLQIFSETGLIGLLSFLSIFIIFFFNVSNFFINEKSNKNKLVLLGLILGIICFLIDSLFTFPLHVPACGAAFFILVALSCSFLKKFEFQIIAINKISIIKNIKIKKVFSFLVVVIILIFSIHIINNIVIKPFLAHRYAFCAENRMAHNKDDEALLFYQLSLRNNPKYGQMWLNLGALYYNANMIDEAIESLLKSKQYYSHQNIHYNLGLVYAASGELERAEQEFNYAIYLEPKFWLAHNALASLYVYQEEYQKAIEQWERAINLGFNFEEKHIFLYFIGMAWERMGDTEQAYHYFLEALKEAPDDSLVMADIEKELLNIYCHGDDSH